MQALVCHALGSFGDLRVEEVPDPVPTGDQVVVRVAAAAVNYVDALTVLGRYQLKPPTPYTPGVDIAGTVAATGPDCTGFTVGDRVHGLAPFGAYAEQAVTTPGWLRHTPDGLAADLAVTTGTPYRTAIDSLVSVGRATAGEDVVVLGASGAVGSAAIGVAKALGARVIACASTAAKLDHCTRLGADEVVDYTAEPLKERLKQLCGGGADVVLDLVGGAWSEQALRATGRGGRFVVIGFASGEVARVPLNLVLLKGSTIAGYEILDFESHFPAEADANRSRLESMMADGSVVPPITARYPLAEARLALEHAAGRDKQGLTLLEIGHL